MADVAPRVSERKKGSTKKKYEIIRNGHRRRPIILDGKEYKLGDKTGGMQVYDEGVAKAIHQKYGHPKDGGSDEVRVIPVDNRRSDGIHNYSFVVTKSLNPEDKRTMKERLQDDPDMVEVRPGVWKHKRDTKASN